MLMLARPNRNIGRLVVGARCEAGMLGFLPAMRTWKEGNDTGMRQREQV
jgi:hypothetical protein